MAEVSNDLVAYWDVPLSDKIYRIEFEHGTISGKRVIRVNGDEILRRDFMFKLIGTEEFMVGTAKCVIRIDPMGGFSYSYSILVNGKSLKTFSENQSRILKTWIVNFDGEKYRVVLEKDTLAISANGQSLATTAEFVDDGAETHFTLGDWPACIKSSTTGNRREGIVYDLIVNDQVLPSVEN